jgi:hypothetical protein
MMNILTGVGHLLYSAILLFFLKCKFYTNKSINKVIETRQHWLKKKKILLVLPSREIFVA